MRKKLPEKDGREARGILLLTIEVQPHHNQETKPNGYFSDSLDVEIATGATFIFDGLAPSPITAKLAGQEISLARTPP